MKRYVAAIDPGVKGALVVIDFNRKVYEKIPFDALSDMGIMSTIEVVCNKYPGVIFVKEIFIPSYSNGNTAFKVGRQHGIIDTTIKRRAARMIEVRASDWQRQIHKKDPNLKAKYLSLLAAEELFAEEEWRIPLKRKLSLHPHDGLVDAALIAWHGVSLLVAEISARSR